MEIRIQIGDKEYRSTLDEPIDISIPLKQGGGLKAFYAPDYHVEPVRAGDFVGSIDEGGVVNFFNIFVNPHGNGTHTECVGHISENSEKLIDCLKNFHFSACLYTVDPIMQDNGDRIITQEQIRLLSDKLEKVSALILRTLPNNESKKDHNYSGTNPVYMEPECMDILNEKSIDHLLLDLPSVDREEDGGALSAHRRFWKYPEDPQRHKTITEMVFIPNEIHDGYYLLNLQVGSYDIDASPSKPVIFQLRERG